MTTPHRSPAPLGWLALVLRVILGGLFVFAGVIKLSTPQAFAFSVKGFHILPLHLVEFVTFAVPWTEVIAGSALILGVWGRAAAMVIGGLLAAFIAGIVSVIARDMDVKCGCFGKYEWPCTGALGVCQLIRNGVMLSAAVFLVIAGPGSLAVDRPSKS